MTLYRVKLLALKCNINMPSLQTLTSYSSILWVAIVTANSRATGATDEGCLTASTPNVVKVDCTSASTKMCITKGHCICYNKYIVMLAGKSQEVAQNFYISSYNTIGLAKNTFIKHKLYIIEPEKLSDLEWSIQAVDTPQWHQYCSMSHHTQCPTHCSYRSLLGPHLECYLLLISADQLCKELCYT